MSQTEHKTTAQRLSGKANLSRAIQMAILVAFLSGCSTHPKAGVSDPMVFTTVHLANAARTVTGSKADLADELNRYFRKKPDDYELVKLRMDEMLDSRQRQSAYFQAVQTLMSLDVVVNVLKELPALPVDTTEETEPAEEPEEDGSGAADAEPAEEPEEDGSGDTADTEPVEEPEEDGKEDAGETVPTNAEGSGCPQSTDSPALTSTLNPLRKKLAEKVGEVLDKVFESPTADSPFDALDRATDFYTAYIIKLLRRYGDGRARATKPVADGGYGDTDRLILLVLQAHVHPGNRANYMSGVRVKIAEAHMLDNAKVPSRWNAQDGSPDLVKVIRLHPTRSYDLDQVAAGESLLQSLAITTSAKIPGKTTDVDVRAARQAMLEAEARRKFLSRITKNVSYANAPEHEFGWNFYPSNLEVTSPGTLGQLCAWLFGTPRAFEVTAYLEGGARDCAAYLVVPRNLASFKCNVSSVHGSVDHRGLIRMESQSESAETFTVHLPPWQPEETEVAAAPFLAGAHVAGKNSSQLSVEEVTADDQVFYEILLVGEALEEGDKEKLKLYNSDAMTEISSDDRTKVLAATTLIEGTFRIPKTTADAAGVVMVGLRGSTAKLKP